MKQQRNLSSKADGDVAETSSTQVPERRRQFELHKKDFPRCFPHLGSVTFIC